MHRAWPQPGQWLPVVDRLQDDLLYQLSGYARLVLAALSITKPYSYCTLFATTKSEPHSAQTSSPYRWRNKYGGMDVPDAKKLKALETGNAKLKKLVAEQLRSCYALKAAL